MTKPIEPDEPNASTYRTRTFVLFLLFLLLFTLPSIAFLFVSRQFWAQPAVVMLAPVAPILVFFALFFLGLRVFRMPILSIIQVVAGAGISSIIIGVACLAATGQITKSNLATLAGFIPPVLFFVVIFFGFRKAGGKPN